MKSSLPVRFIPVALALVGSAAVAHWIARPLARQDIALRVPVAEDQGGAAAEGPGIDMKGEFTAGAGTAADLPGDWSQFRGPNRDGINPEAVKLKRSFGPTGPPKLWSLELGEGHAGVAVRKGRVYLLDYDEKLRRDVLRCLSLADGKDIWQRSYAVDIGRNHGVSRTVPAVTDTHVVTIGPKCHVLCVDAISGDFRWGIDLVRQHRATVPDWYAGQCPLIDGPRVILAPGGDALMIAVDLADGKVLWKTPNPLGWEMTHSSIAMATVAGRKMYIYCASGGVAGVSADDGALLWVYPAWKVTMANVPTPVVVGEGKIFLSGGYNAGSMLLELKLQGTRFVPEARYRLKAEVFGAEQHTPILYQGRIYGVSPGGQLVCLDPETGKRIWASGSANRFGTGPYLIADGLVLLMNDTAVFTVAEANEKQYTKLAQAKIFEEAHDSWGPFALAGGRLIVRDATRMACLDMREGQ